MSDESIKREVAKRWRQLAMGCRRAGSVSLAPTSPVISTKDDLEPPVLRTRNGSSVSQRTRIDMQMMSRRHDDAIRGLGEQISQLNIISFSGPVKSGERRTMTLSEATEVRPSGRKLILWPTHGYALTSVKHTDTEQAA